MSSIRDKGDGGDRERNSFKELAHNQSNQIAADQIAADAHYID